MALVPEENPLYAAAERVHPLHWDNLRRREPSEAARAAGAEWRGGAYRLPMLGRELHVSPAERRVLFAAGRGQVGYSRALAAVAYLAGAVDAPCRGEWVAFRQLPGGEAFFRGPHGVPAERLAVAFGASPGSLRAAAASLGGSPAEGGDEAAVLPALPRIPLQAVLWAGSAEFGASAALLVDARAHLHAPLDVLWALAHVAIDDLVKERRC